MTSKRPARRCEPTKGFESLEGRELLTGGGVIGLDGKYINKFDYQKMLAKRATPPAPPSDRRVEMPLPQYGPDAKAIFTLYGNGTLVNKFANGTTDFANSTHLDPNGGIHLIFDGTNFNSQIIGSLVNVPNNVNPSINEIRDADVSPYDTTGVGTNQIGYLNLNRFNLGNGGRINLSAGVQRLFINDIGHSTQLDLAALATPPTTSPQNPGGLNSTTTTSTSGSTAVTNSTGQKTITTTVNGITVITTLPTTDQLTVSNNELTGVGGIILPGSIPSTSGNTRVEVQGVELIVRNVNGANNPLVNPNPSPRLGVESIAGVDASNNQLLTFNIVRDPSTWAITQANLTSTVTVARYDGDTTSPLVGAAVAQYGNATLPVMNVKGTQQVVVVAYGNHVQAYRTLDGSEIGHFTVNASTGINHINGIGGSGGVIFLTDSADGSNSTGVTQGFDLTQSLNTGTAVTTGTPFQSPKTFESLGGTTAVAGISYLYNAGAAFFDPYTPINTTPQLGVMKLNVASNYNLSVNTSAKVSNLSVASQSYVMGSVDQNLILVSPNPTITNGYQTQTLLNPNTLASAGTIQIQYGSTLSGLSESYYPQLFGSSVIDIKGNLKTFTAVNTDNMVLNVNGIANFTRINDAQNTTIIAHPILHLAVSWKPGANVNLISSARPTNTTPGGKTRPGTRGGVQIVKKLPVIGPLVNPAQQKI